MRVKRLACRACGGPKRKPPRTAYVYCDYCGTFTDWDFQIATQTPGSRDPGPHYEALRTYLHPRMEEARLARDGERYVAYQRQLFEAHVAACPAAYSPRVGDPTYRAAIVCFSAVAKGAAELDEGLVAAAARVAVEQKRLRWVAPAGHARSDTFWKLFEAFRAFEEARVAVLERWGALAWHPDALSAELSLRLAYSAFAQEWLPRLEPADGAELLRRTDLAGEYAEIEPAETSARRCGACAAAVDVVAGATCVLCEACGFLVDVSTPEIACPHCGGPVSRVAGTARVQCPCCKSVFQLTGGPLRA